MAKRAGPTFEEVAQSFRRGQFSPLYFLYGDEPFLMDELQQLLLQTAIQPHERDFNLDILHGPETDVQQVLAACASYPMMAERRVVIVRAFEKLKDNARFMAYAESPNPGAVVMLICGSKPNLSHNPYRALKAKAEAVELTALNDRALPGWIRGRLKETGINADPGAAERLAMQMSGDLYGVVSEIDKLAAYLGDRTRLTEDDVLEVAGQTREQNIFALREAIGRGESVEAIAIAERILGAASDRRGEALKMVAILSRYVIKLWLVSGLLSKRVQPADVARQIGVAPYHASGYISAAKNFSAGQLRNAFQALLAADFELKGGSERPPQAVVLLLLRRLQPMTKGAAA